MLTDYNLWQQDNEIAAKSVVGQESYDEVLTEFGVNDFVIDFLMLNGLWDTLVNSRALLLKKGNGKDVSMLNGALAIKELAGVKCIGNSGKLLRDGPLMATLGFNLEEVLEKDSKSQGVVCENTLRNNLSRIPSKETYYQFYQHVKFLRQKKWLRGGTYAVDGYEIEISVEEARTTYEDAGKVWSSKEKRFKYGYKLLLLVNIADGRERIVGMILDRIETNELKMFRRMLRYIRHYVCPIEEMIKLLVADRAYWDEKLMRYLKEEKGIDFVMLAKDNLCIVKDDLKDLIKRGSIQFKPYRVKNPKYYQRKTDHKLTRPSKEKEYIELELAVERDFDYQVFADGYLNVVIRKETKGKKVHYIFYVTTLKIKNPVTIVKQYSERSAIENDVNRELDQRWHLRTLAGRSKNIMLGRIALVLKLFNCEKIMEMKVENKYREMKKRMRERERHSFFNHDAEVIVYIPGRNVFGLFSVKNWSSLVEQRTVHRIANATTLSPDQIFELISKN